MKEMKSKVVALKPGTILCWKDYNMFKTAWSKLTGKHLDYNRFVILIEPTDFITSSEYNSNAYEPVRVYNQKEIAKLVKLVKANKDNTTFADIKVIVNAIRPKTFDAVLTLDDCKYYKKLDLNANAIEYLYKAE